MDKRNNLIADRVVINAGQSWYSQQLELGDPNSGVSFEIRLDRTGSSADGAFYPRAGNARRNYGPAVVATTCTRTLDSDYLPEMRIDQEDLIDVSAEVPCETLLNIGNVNARYVQLEFRCTTGSFILSIRPCEKRG